LVSPKKFISIISIPNNKARIESLGFTVAAFLHKGPRCFSYLTRSRYNKSTRSGTGEREKKKKTQPLALPILSTSSAPPPPAPPHLTDAFGQGTAAAASHSPSQSHLELHRAATSHPAPSYRCVRAGRRRRRRAASFLLCPSVLGALDIAVPPFCRLRRSSVCQHLLHPLVMSG
jgi:hypothetical protein